MGIGRWGTTTTAQGGLAGALGLPVLDDAELARLVETVNRVRSLDLPGVLPVIDLVEHAGRVWLITAAPATPTLAQAGPVTATQATRLATEVGQTLSALHRAGVAHGALEGSAVIVTADGARLIEVGLAAAIAGAPAEVAADVAAWAELVSRLLPGDAVLSAVATTAAERGLDAALLVLAASVTASVDTPIPAPREPAAAAPSDVPAGARTLLGRAGAPRPAPGADATAEDLPTQLGRGRSAALAGNAVAAAVAPTQGGAPGADHAGRGLRFGPGVPAGASQARSGPAPRTARRRRWARFISTVTVLALVAAAAGYLWRHFYPGLAISAVHIASVTVDACDSAADVVAIVHTNGMAGTITYRWQTHVDGRAPDDTTAEVRQHVDAGQETVPLHLAWSFAGRGSAAGRATFAVSAPTAVTASAAVNYRCG